MILIDGVPGAAFGARTEGNPRIDESVRRAVASELGITDEWAWVRQVHGADVLCATAPGVIGEADGIFTTVPGLPVAVSVADCLPVALIADGAAGMAHAGWRGVVADVVGSTIEAMTLAGHPPHTAVIGPGIGPCCFEVGDEVADQFRERTARTTWGSRSVDLVGAVIDGLVGVEVRTTGVCTHHDDRFHSYRRDGTTDRQFGVTWVPLG